MRALALSALISGAIPRSSASPRNTRMVEPLGEIRSSRAPGAVAALYRS
jgi:hypothetical protein